MKDWKRLLRRLTAIYIAYFAALLIGFIGQMPDMGKSFMEGHTQAINHAALTSEYHLDASLKNVPVEHFSSEGVAVDVAFTQAAVTMSSTGGTGVGHGTGWSFLLHLVAELAQVTILVLMGVIIYSLRRSIRKGLPFMRVNILRTRWIGALILAGEILAASASWIDGRAAASLLAGNGIGIDTSIDISYWNVSMGILILFMAEVVAIGYRLSEEQKLTI